MRRHSLSVFLLTVVVGLSGVAVFAHMKATRMEPGADSTLTTPPARIEVWFTQVPDKATSRLELAGPSGAVKLTGFQVTKEKSIVAAIDGELADGRYTARWQSAGDDGHVQKGQYVFTVKRSR